ncbi:MAG: TIGR03643 family protein [Burkholderiaceae bacterium]|nr:TIGR03643 family protein [Burkholderiaceae bacterium]
MAKPVPRLTPDDIQRIIATAWDDRPPFDAVLRAHGLTHGQVVALLKRELTPNAYKVWTARTTSSPGSPARRARR